MKKLLTLASILLVSAPSLAMAKDNWFCTGIKGNKHCEQGKYGRASESLCKELCNNYGLSAEEIKVQKEEAARLARAKQIKKLKMKK